MKKNSKKKKKQNKRKLINKSDTVVLKKDNPIKKIFSYYLISRICLVILLFLAEFIISNSDYSEYDDVLLLFDNLHYLNIAKNGYVSEFLYAFFPLTPLLIRYLSKVGYILLNQVLVFASAYFLYLIGRDVFEKDNPYYPASEIH